MRSFNYCRVLLFLVIVFSSGVSIASTITYYKLTPPWDESARSPTPLAACETYNPNPNATYRYNGLCYRTIWGSESFIGHAVAYNEVCPLGNTGLFCNDSCEAPNEMIDGQCSTPPPDPCAGKTGASDPFNKSGTAGDGYGFATGGGKFSPAQDGCFGGCAASTADQKCVFKVDGSYSCRGTMRYTGGSCTTSPPVDNADPGPEPSPQDYSDTSPCIYSADGSGAQVCTSSTTQGTQGQHCGTVNGVQTCVDIPPTENGISVSTKVQTTTNADGSTSTTKTDTATSTKCTGIGVCTSTTSTSTKTTTKDASGTTTGATGSCEGSLCPDENGNPDGDGDGFGDCVGGECEEGAGGAGDWYEPGEDTYQSVIEAYADRIADTPVLSGVSNFLTFTPSGACPVYTVDTWVFSIRLDQWCSGSTIPWELIQAVILAAAAFFAFRIAFL